ncbi:MAG: hypothetical protein IK079_00145 [Desulfovibrio sp.]|nr:hypothetical protein [Desulfovibrio sp.]
MGETGDIAITFCVYYIFTLKAKPGRSIKFFVGCPTEIYQDRENYRIYLGSTSIEAVVSLYGLINLTIYGIQKLRKHLYEVNEAPRVENIEPLLKYLHSAAVLKVLTYA